MTAQPICGEPHPDDQTLRCSMPPGNHQYHTAVRPGVPPLGVDWKNADYVEAVRHRTSSQRQVLKRDLADRVRRAAGGVPDEAAEHWRATKGQWIEQAKHALHDYARHHPGPFTTAEDIWPLVDCPGEMRAFSLVVQYALRHRWIVEDGFKRLRGTYATRDGVLFSENKAVPIYRSRLYVAESSANS